MIATTKPPMSSPRPKFARRVTRWLLPAALLALMPKCALCVLAYVGVGAALGLSGPELCGAPSGTTGEGMTLLWMLGILLGTVGFLTTGMINRIR